LTSKLPSIITYCSSNFCNHFHYYHCYLNQWIFVIIYHNIIAAMNHYESTVYDMDPKRFPGTSVSCCPCCPCCPSPGTNGITESQNRTLLLKMALIRLITS
jgi:hypothetical protein